MALDESLGNVQAVCVAIAFGALIAAWAHQHFHAQYRPEQIRFSVPQNRYFFALSMHICTIAAAYGIVVLFFYAVWAYRDCLNCALADISKTDLDPRRLVWAALISAICVRIVVPILPVTRHIADQLRSLMLGLASFPSARAGLVAAMAAQKFNPRQGADAALAEQLAVYGVARKTMELLSRSAKQTLIEVHSARERLLEQLGILQDDEAPLPIWSATDVLTGRKGPEASDKPSRQARRFWRARIEDWRQLEADFQRLLRRSARALLLAEDVNTRAADPALCRAISGFVAEESEELLVQYRRLIADLALACEPEHQQRVDVLKSFGYQVSVRPLLPLHPWVIVFSLDFLLFLIPTLISPFTGINFPVTTLVLFACVHAISQTVAITWAICPKIVSNFARPSLYSLPWQSYIVYGFGSFFSGGIILLIFRLNIQMPGDFPIGIPTLLSSLSFLLMTVGISVLIDLWLLNTPSDFRRHQLRDGLVIGLLMLTSTATFQVIMFDSGWFHLDPPPPGLIRLLFLVLSPGLGFVMGYFVPSAAARYLKSSSVRGPALFGHQSLADAIRASETQRNSQDSAQRSLPAG